MPVATPKAALRDKLKGVRSELEDKRGERPELLNAREQAKEAFATAEIEPGNMTESAEFKATEQTVRELGTLDDQIADLQKAESGILEALGEGIPDPRGNHNGPSGAEDPEQWSGAVEQLLRGDEFQALLATGQITSRSKLGSHNIGQLASREDTVRLVSGGDMDVMTDVGSTEKQGAIAADRRGIVQPGLPTLNMLDLIPTGTTDSNTVEYVQVTAVPESAAETAEGEEKPEESFTTKDADAPVRTIAGWIKVRRQSLADVAMLGSMIATLLPFDVRRRLQRQMLIGNGEDQNILGLYNTQGVGAPGGAEGDNQADRILRAITVIHLSNGDPNFVGLHPISWQDLLLMRENQAERTGQYLYGSPASLAAPTIWGVAITKNPAASAAKPIVGDGNAAMVAVREGLTVRISDSDGDDFRRNRVTVLAEMRAAFPVWRPSSFAIAPREGS